MKAVKERIGEAATARVASTLKTQNASVRAAINNGRPLDAEEDQEQKLRFIQRKVEVDRLVASRSAITVTMSPLTETREFASAQSSTISKPNLKTLTATKRICCAQPLPPSFRYPSLYRAPLPERTPETMSEPQEEKVDDGATPALSKAGETASWTIPLVVSVSLGAPTTSETTAPASKKKADVSNAAEAFKFVPDPKYSNRRGYNPNFLGVKVPLPKLTPDQRKIDLPPFPGNLPKDYQVTIAEIEKLTDLDFGALREHDTFTDGSEAISGHTRRQIERLADIQIHPRRR